MSIYLIKICLISRIMYKWSVCFVSNGQLSSLMSLISLPRRFEHIPSLCLVLQVSDHPHLFNHSLVDTPVSPIPACSDGDILHLKIIWTAEASSNQRHLYWSLQVDSRQWPLFGFVYYSVPNMCFIWSVLVVHWYMW